jgi:hypothetical protein
MRYGKKHMSKFVGNKKRTHFEISEKMMHPLLCERLLSKKGAL